MIGRVYYNDFDPFCCKWLRALIKEGLLPEGEVDERPIQEVEPSDLRGFTQVHFFAGIGGWAKALQLAEWPEDRKVWTGSCPCQPFSSAGKAEGFSDKRHLWPEFRRLIAECLPSEVFGEQVASPLGRTWLTGVQTDLETLGYGVGRADVCAAGVNSPQKRQRLWWVAVSVSRILGMDESKCNRFDRKEISENGKERERSSLSSGAGGNGNISFGLEKSHGIGWGGRNVRSLKTNQGNISEIETVGSGSISGLEHTISEGRKGCGRIGREQISQGRDRKNGHSSEECFWSDSVFYPCRDGYRRVPVEWVSQRASAESEIQCVVDGISEGMGEDRLILDLERFPFTEKISNAVEILKGVGNAVVPELAAEWIRTYMEILV